VLGSQDYLLCFATMTPGGILVRLPSLNMVVELNFHLYNGDEYLGGSARIPDPPYFGIPTVLLCSSGYQMLPDEYLSIFLYNFCLHECWQRVRCFLARCSVW
jgi:hypothetical protein